MQMICPYMPIPDSTEIDEFLYISRLKNYCIRAPSEDTRWAHAPLPLYPPLLDHM